MDTFTELTARKKQYTYYRDQLLSFEDGEVEWKAVGDVCIIGDGLHGIPQYCSSGCHLILPPKYSKRLHQLHHF